MAFSSLNASQSLKPAAPVVSGTPGFGMDRTAFGKLVHRPVNTFGSTLSLYGDTNSANPSMLFTAGFGGPKIAMGPADGATAPDVALQRGPDTAVLTNNILTLQPPVSDTGDAGRPMRIGLDLSPPSGSSVMMVGTPATGGAVSRLEVSGTVSGATNGTRGDSILTDAANTGGHDSFAAIKVVSTGSLVYADRGSYHQIYTSMEVDPYLFGTAYCEALNVYGAIDNRRKGAFVSNCEWMVRNTGGAGSPARIAGLRLIIREGTPLSSYNSTNLGAGSRFIQTGAMGLEVYADQTTQAGTGIQITQLFGGFRRAISVTDPVTGSVTAGGIDGRGGVFTRTKAGTPVDGDFSDPRDGMLAVNTSTNVLYFRSGGVWRAAN